LNARKPEYLVNSADISILAALSERAYQVVATVRP
jgi:hypothetical protein